MAFCRTNRLSAWEVKTEKGAEFTRSILLVFKASRCSKTAANLRVQNKIVRKRGRGRRQKRVRHRGHKRGVNRVVCGEKTGILPARQASLPSSSKNLPSQVHASGRQMASSWVGHWNMQRILVSQLATQSSETTSAKEKRFLLNAGSVALRVGQQVKNQESWNSVFFGL